MILTYSVIIQNKTTAESFSRHLPLFTEALNNNRIGICKWVESGTTIDTALPELRELTDDKEEWTAVIVRYEDDPIMADFAHDAKNPYDFLVNSASVPAVCESDVPLIRLTHMLGGVPAPEPVFQHTQTVDENGRQVFSYLPVDRSDELSAHRRLCEKYAFNGHLPTRVLMLTVRSFSAAEPQKTDRVSKNNDFFWKRNRYPSNCRFMVYDFSQEGPVQKTAEEFNFWLSTLLVSINEIDTSSLQAYKLYNVSTKLNKTVLHESLQSFSDRLSAARRQTELTIREEFARQLSASGVMPPYHVDVPVAVKEEEFAKKAVSKRSFGLLSPSAKSETADWRTTEEKEAEKLKKYKTNADRTLNQAALRMKDNCTCTADESYPLDAYVEQDLKSETDVLRNTIIGMQGNLPDEDSTKQAELKQTTEAIRTFLLRRIQKKPAVAMFFFVFFMLTVAGIPAAVHAYNQNSSTLWGLLAVLGVQLLLVILFSVFILLQNKRRLNALLQSYITQSTHAYARVSAGIRMFTDYLTSIATHAKGCSYLQMSGRRQNETKSLNKMQTAHLHTITRTHAKIQTWADAFYCTLQPLPENASLGVSIDYGISPRQNLLYAFESDFTLQIPLNASGETIHCPFCFAEKLEIVKEEL